MQGQHPCLWVHLGRLVPRRLEASVDSFAYCQWAFRVVDGKEGIPRWPLLVVGQHLPNSIRGRIDCRLCAKPHFVMYQG